MRRWNTASLNADALFRQKRQAVVRAAARAFLDRGFAGTALDDIAGSLGVTKAALYYYIRSKQDILRLCHEAALELMEAALDQARAVTDNGRGAVIAFVTAYGDAARSDLGLCLFVENLSNLAEADRSVLLHRRAQARAALADLIRRGQGDATLREDIMPEDQADFVLGSLRGVLLQDLALRSAPAPEGESKAIPDLPPLPRLGPVPGGGGTEGAGQDAPTAAAPQSGLLPLILDGLTPALPNDAPGQMAIGAAS